jgi:hypothetical protein
VHTILNHQQYLSDKRQNRLQYFIQLEMNKKILTECICGSVLLFVTSTAVLSKSSTPRDRSLSNSSDIAIMIRMYLVFASDDNEKGP